MTCEQGESYIQGYFKEFEIEGGGIEKCYWV